MSFCPRTLCRQNTIAFQIPVGFYMVSDKLILNLICKIWRKSQDLLEEKEWIVVAFFTRHQTCSKAVKVLEAVTQQWVHTWQEQGWILVEPMGSGWTFQSPAIYMRKQRKMFLLSKFQIGQGLKCERRNLKTSERNKIGAWSSVISETDLFQDDPKYTSPKRKSENCEHLFIKRCHSVNGKISHKLRRFAISKTSRGLVLGTCKGQYT